MATEVPEDHVDLMVKEIELTKLLSVSINPETRNDVIALIKQLLLKHSEHTNDAFELNHYLMIWRGLINLMWKSDKLLPQESVIEEISYLIHSCISYQGKILFLNALFITIKDECMSISQHHIDKYMMLVRHCLRQLLFTFIDCGWNLENIMKLSTILYRSLESFTLSLRSRLQDIFLEELAEIAKPGKPYNDLEMLEGETADDRRCDENVNVGIPCIKFNPKGVAKVLNKYVAEVDCTRKCSLEFTKFTKHFSRLRDSILSYKPIDLKLNSQVLKQRKKKYPSQMLYEGVEQLEIVDSKIKKNGHAVNVHKNLKQLNKMAEIVVERGKIGKFMWKVRKFDNVNTLNMDLNLNRSWTVSEETKNDSTITVCMNDKPLLLVPAGFKVAVIETSEQIPTKVQKQISTPSIISLTVGSSLKESNSNKHKNKRIILKINDGSNKKIINKRNSPFIKVGTPKASNASHNSLSLSSDYGRSALEKALLPVPAGFKVEVLETPGKTPTKIQKKVSTPNSKSIKVDSSLKKSNSNKHKNKRIMLEINDGSNKKIINKRNSPFIKVGTPKASNASHNSLSVSSDYGRSALKKASLPVPAGFKVEVLETPGKTPTKIQKKVSTPNSKSIKVDSSLKESNSNKHKNKRMILKINDGSNKKIINKRNSPLIKVGTPKASNACHNSWSVSSDYGRSALEKALLPVLAGFKVEILETPEKTTTEVQKNVSIPNGNHVIDSKSNKPSKERKRISLKAVITPDKSFKCPESPTFEQKVLRQRTIIIPKKITEGQNEGTPKRKVQETSATIVLQKRRKIIAEGINMSKPEKNLIKAHEKVRNEAFENGFGSLRRSPRLSIKPEKNLIKAHEKVRSEAFENGFGSLRRSPSLSIKPDCSQC